MDAVGGYLDALRRQDWTALHATLHPDIVRHGPYGDDVTGRDEYVDFLTRTFTMLGDYELEVHRTFGTATRVCVELAETATVGEERLRTEEALVFALEGAAITQVRVFLQRSTPV